jgi:hypothetical protein
MAQTSIAGVKINPLFIWRSPERNHSRHTLRRQRIDEIMDFSQLGIALLFAQFGPWIRLPHISAGLLVILCAR